MKYTSPRALLTHAYLATHQAPRSLLLIKRLSSIGITVGACALTLALIITRGFERDIGAKMKGINSDVVIEAPGQQLDAPALCSYITAACGPIIAGASASNIRTLIVDTEHTSRVLFLRGIDPAAEEGTTTLASKITAPLGASLTTLLATPNSIVIGTQSAKLHRAWLGSTLTGYIARESGRTKLALEKNTFEIAGIFSLGLEDYDAHIAYCSLETMKALYSDCQGADHLALSFAPAPWQHPPLSWRDYCRSWLQRITTTTEDYHDSLIKKLQLLLPSLSVRSWKQLYPDLVASLALEKYAFTIVLGLIGLVASMLIVCLLFMFLQYKRTDIAILQTMGMSIAELKKVFLYIGMTIVAKATGAGIVLAWCIGFILDTYKPIRLPDIYYISYLPAAMEPMHAVLVFLSMLCIGFMACRFALRTLSSGTIVSVLRDA